MVKIRLPFQARTDVHAASHFRYDEYIHCHSFWRLLSYVITPFMYIMWLSRWKHEQIVAICFYLLLKDLIRPVLFRIWKFAQRENRTSGKKEEGYKEFTVAKSLLKRMMSELMVGDSRWIGQMPHRSKIITQWKGIIIKNSPAFFCSTQTWDSPWDMERIEIDEHPKSICIYI